jgi:hypothetical protein
MRKNVRSAGAVVSMLLVGLARVDSGWLYALLCELQVNFRFKYRFLLPGLV